MGQRNMHMIELEADRQGHDYIHPEPCLFYGAMTNFPQPNLHPAVPPPINGGNYNMHHIPEHHEGGMFYSMPQYNQYPGANLDLVGASSCHPYNPYMASPCAPRDFPIQVNHGMVGVPTDSFGRVIPYLDGVRGPSKRKNTEGLQRNAQYVTLEGSSSSSVGPSNASQLESGVTQTDVGPPFVPHELSGPVIENGPNRSMRNNRPNVAGQDSILARNSNHSAQANFVGQPYQLPSAPWMGVDVNSFSWNQAAPIPYMHGLQGYQVGGSPPSFMHTPPMPQGHPNVHHQPPHVQGLGTHSMSYSAQQMVAPSRRFFSNGAVVGPFPGVVEAGARYMGPAPPAGFRVYRPHRRDVTAEVNARHRNLPHLRMLPEDGVAILEVSGYQEAGDAMDQHREMRLDIDDMSYEELLELGEQIGHVVTGLPEAAIAANMKTRLFSSLAGSSSVDEASCVKQEVDFCVVCQTGYKVEEEIGTLDCGHEYHVGCIKQWLLVKNTCPICKSTALTERKSKGKGKGKGKGKDV